jgi:tetratricopeptide (TPR) repeat protein
MNLWRAEVSENTTVDHRGARLVGWKDIAAYLGKTDRTVKRWGRDHGLPVHRVPGAAKASVYAYASEVDRWLESNRGSGAKDAREPDEKAPLIEQRADRDATIGPGLGNREAGEAKPQDRVFQEHALPDQRLQNLGRQARSTHRSLGRWLFAGLAVLLSVISLDVAIHLRATPLASKLRGFLSKPAATSGASLTVSADEQRVASEFYLRGRYEWNQRTPATLHRALDLFTQAIVHNPGDARAYAGLADTYDLLREYSTEADSDAFPRAIAAAKKAVALDPSLAEGHRALAFAEMYGDWNFAGAEEEFKRAIELDPRDPQARRWYANAIALAGRYPEALAQMNKAQELDPTSHTTIADKGWMLYNASHAQSGIELLKEVERSAPEFSSPHSYLMQIDLDRHDYRSFLFEGQRTADLTGDAALGELISSARLGYERSGERGALEALYEKQKASYAAGKSRAIPFAKTCILMGKRSEAFDVMEAAYRQHDFEVLALLSDPALVVLKGEQRYRALVAKINYPESLRRER